MRALYTSGVRYLLSWLEHPDYAYQLARQPDGYFRLEMTPGFVMTREARANFHPLATWRISGATVKRLIEDEQIAVVARDETGRVMLAERAA